MAGSVGKSVERSDALAGVLARALAIYLRLCRRTGRWTADGEDVVDRALASGPVTLIFWHGRLMMAPPLWRRRAPIAIPRDPSPAGRLSAATQAQFGIEPFEIRAKGGNFGVMRQLMRLARSGHSLGLTADGPKGPDRQAKRAAVDWARAAGRPVVLFAWSSRRVVRLSTWDGMMVPLPFSGGAFVCRLWTPRLPERLDEADYERLQRELSVALDEVTESADRLAGRGRK